MTIPDQFVVYRVVPSTTRPGKTDKVPIAPSGRVTIDAHLPAHWMTREAATAAAVRLGQGHGVGFVITEADDYWFMDLDECRAGDAWSAAAVMLCNRLPGAYVEVSVSGRGLHIIGRGRVPPHGTKCPTLGADLYSKLRFCALTGTGARGDMDADLTAAINAVAAEYFPPGSTSVPSDWTEGPCEGYGGPADDDDLIRIACAAQSAAAALGSRTSFKHLWEGDAEALSKHFPDDHGYRPYDASRADAALAQHLAFWTGKDCARIRRLMERSALRREKWENRDDYLPRTITAACGQQQAVATGSRQTADPAIPSEPDTQPDNDAADTESIARLAALPPLDYERCREIEARRMGVRIAVLDDQVKKKRGTADEAPGRGVVLHDPEPWLEPVRTEALLDGLASAIRRHVIMPPSAADAVALWIVHTWVAGKFDHTPRLGVTSPVKKCGKSTLLEILRLTCRRTVKADNISASGVFRTVEALRPLTLLIDEADSFLAENEELRGVLNSGFERSGNVIRVAEVKGEHQPLQFATFAPCALAAIGDLPTTLADRSVPIRMIRKTAGETVHKLRAGQFRAGLADLARKAARWAGDNMAALSADPAIPEAMGDREGDISVPLLAIADHAGAVWAERGRRALLEQFHIAAEAEASAESGILLLTDIRAIFAERSMVRLSSVELCRTLEGMETRPWPEWKNGKPISPTQLARVLKPFKVRPVTYRTPDGGTVKGYQQDHFAEAWNRYLGPDTQPGGADP